LFNRKETRVERAQYRQGDVLLVAIEKIPAGTKLKKQPRARLAEGEVTGHAHVLDAPAEGELLTDVDAEFIRILGANGLLHHEEHDAIEVPPGDYQRVAQREYTPEEIRMVAD
jgi:hypothetical protein